MPQNYGQYITSSHVSMVKIIQKMFIWTSDLCTCCQEVQDTDHQIPQSPIPETIYTVSGGTNHICGTLTDLDTGPTLISVTTSDLRYVTI